MIKLKLRGAYGKGKYALIDDDMGYLVTNYKWFLSRPKISGHQYIRTRMGKNDVRLHRFIMNAQHGDMIDHINRDTLDNRRCNLRYCTNAQNQFNSRRHRDKEEINGVVVPKGIKYDKTRPHRPWFGRVIANGKRISTKGFSTIEEASREYALLAKKYHGEFTRIDS